MLIEPQVNLFIFNPNQMKEWTNFLTFIERNGVTNFDEKDPYAVLNTAQLGSQQVRAGSRLKWSGSNMYRLSSRIL